MDSEALRVEEAQRMIEDLQAQVRLLTQKATAAGMLSESQTQLVRILTDCKHSRQMGRLRG